MKEFFNTKINADLKRALKELSEETMIPQSKLTEVAFQDLFKKYKKEVKSEIKK
ncbi:ribbon-helix-helix domain-containing protein [Desulfosporosinus sp. SYSU MS00001]|uniref:ribbon-helix-helix domain-containing protein n=1 Tax=Desulfosporosinus sp. SYSU MS00001 TaxID=3416284 RepID=UPI003CF06ADA